MTGSCGKLAKRAKQKIPSNVGRELFQYPLHVYKKTEAKCDGVKSLLYFLFISITLYVLKPQVC